MISEFPISVTPISESSDSEIRKTPISGAMISGKTVISQLARIQMQYVIARQLQPGSKYMVLYASLSMYKYV